MKLRKADASHLTTETARHGTWTANFEVDLRLPPQSGRRGRDPLVGIWDNEIVPMLKAAPGLCPIVVFREICSRHPDIRPGVRRKRRVRHWQALNDPGQDVMFRQLPSPDQWFVMPRVVSNFLRFAHQGILQISDLPAHAKGHELISDSGLSR